MNKAIYLDCAATTPMDPRVVEKMRAYMTMDGAFANPASTHRLGREAKAAVETARAQVADGIHATPSEILWTSGATESNNLALKGAVHLYQRKGKHIVTLKTEHASVLDCCQQLEKEGYFVTYLLPEADGRVDLNKLASALRAETLLVSIMQVHNELGVIQDIEAIAAITAARGILLHVDAAQSVGKVSIDVRRAPIDLLSLSAHKAYGPKGIGALYIRKKPRIRVEPQMHGGGQEQGMRSGTLATHQIVGMAEAFRIAAEVREEESARIRHLRERFLNGLKNINTLFINGDIHYNVPHIVNLRFEGLLAEALLAQLPELAASTASACQGSSSAGSRVLRALGLSEEQAKASVRFSFGRFTTPDEVDRAAGMISDIFLQRGQSPVNSS